MLEQANTSLVRPKQLKRTQLPSSLTTFQNSLVFHVAHLSGSLMVDLFLQSFSHSLTSMKKNGGVGGWGKAPVAAGKLRQAAQSAIE